MIGELIVIGLTVAYAVNRWHAVRMVQAKAMRMKTIVVNPAVPDAVVEAKEMVREGGDLARLDPSLAHA